MPSVQSLINAMRDVYAEFATNEQLHNIKPFKSAMTRELANTALLCAMKDVLNEDVVQGGVMSTEVVYMYQLVWSRLTSRHVTSITAHRFVRCSTGTHACCTACCGASRNRHGPLRLLGILSNFFCGHGIPGVDCCFCSCRIFSKYQIWSRLLTVLCLVKQTLVAISTRTIRTTTNAQTLPIGVRNLVDLFDTRPSTICQLHKEVTCFTKRLATIIKTGR